MFCESPEIYLHDMTTHTRPEGISAFVRCRNEEEYIVASLTSVHRIFDEIVVILNHSTDRTAELVKDLMTDRPKIRLVTYDFECAGVGPGYLESVGEDPNRSLATYYNWCLEQTTYSHVCKWDGDMIAIPTIERVRELISAYDLVFFDGYDLLGKYTTDYEPRIFRYDPARAKYADWDLYEVLAHNYSKVARVEEKCYLHMKLVKKDWLHKEFVNLNTLATRPLVAPNVGFEKEWRKAGAAVWLRKVLGRAYRRLGRKS
jgi:glycosyltransferase involved in cell wall biosynthesis